MKYSHLELLTLMLDDLKYSGAPKKALVPLSALYSEAFERIPEDFNELKNFASYTMKALEAQRSILESLGELPSALR